jgi:hypothetical protein
VHTLDQHVTAIHSTFKISLVLTNTALQKRIHIYYIIISLSSTAALYTKPFRLPRLRVRGDRSGLREKEHQHARGGPCPTLP